MKKRILLVLAAGLAAAACGGNSEEPKTPADSDSTTPAATAATPKPKKNGGGAPQIQQEFGSLDEQDVARAIKGLDKQIDRCYRQGRKRVEYLSGGFKIYVRLGTDGKVKWGWFEDSSLGDRETEKCLYDAFMAANWPKPIGGDGEIHHQLDWSPGGERAPTSWGPEKVTVAFEAPENSDAKKAWDTCKSGVSADFKVTGYVVDDPDFKPSVPKNPKTGAAQKGPAGEPKHFGKFTAVGVTVAAKEGADKIDCAVDALKQLHLPSPGSYAAKVAVSL